MTKFICALACLLCLCSFSFAQASSGSGAGIGDGTKTQDGKGMGSGSGVVKSDEKNQPLRILSMPKPGYTEQARKNQVQGAIRLRIEFKKDGTIGKKMQVVTGLPDGLVEQAMAAARKIKFVPQKENGKPKTVTKVVEYPFNIY